MTRPSRLVSVIALTTGALAAYVAFSPEALAQGAATAPVAKPVQNTQPSVSELVSLIQAIDPYLPPKNASEQLTGKVEVSGSTSMDALAHMWATGFNEFHKGVKVEVSASGSEEAFEHLVKNPSGVAMLSRPVKDEELDELKKKGLKQPVAIVVAHEALGIFVHKSNPIQSLTGEQMRVVFTTIGKTEPTWGLLGATGDWSAKPIHVVSRTESSGTQIYLRDYIFGGSQMRTGASQHNSNSEVLTAVTNDPLSIAICGLRSSGGAVRPLNLMAGNSVIASDDHAVLEGQYPLTRALSVVVDMGQTDANAKASQGYVQYALCQAGQAQAISASFFPVDLPLLRASLHKLQGAQKQIR